MATSEHKSHHSKYRTSYGESLRILKDNIIQDGRLSGTVLQRCLLINGVPVQDCPTPDQLLQRLGLSHLPQNDTSTNKIGTLERIKKRSSFRMKGRKPRNTTEILIMQLLHSCLHLMSLEATKQTPAHAPLSLDNGEEKEESFRVDKKDTNEKSKDSDFNRQSIQYDNIDLEFCYVKREGLVRYNCSIVNLDKTYPWGSKLIVYITFSIIGNYLWRELTRHLTLLKMTPLC